MSEQYDEAVAAHYTAYRPPLHSLILRRALSGKGPFSRGLDVGSGTGRSSIALAEHCEAVIGVDPSESMIAAAKPQEAITYAKGSSEQLPVPDQSVDVATFAGSLFYSEVQPAANELLRVCKPDALIVPYDFDVLIEGVLRSFGISTQAIESDYDHAANFTGVSAFEELEVQRDRVDFQVSPLQLAHVMLADHVRHAEFAARFETPSPLEAIAANLRSSGQTTLSADIFYSLYRIRPR